MKTKYGNGFDVIIEDILNKNSLRPTKDKNYIQKMNIIFKGSVTKENTNFIFETYLKEIKNKFEGKVRIVMIDCLKRLKRSKNYKI